MGLPWSWREQWAVMRNARRNAVVSRSGKFHRRIVVAVAALASHLCRRHALC